MAVAVGIGTVDEAVGVVVHTVGADFTSVVAAGARGVVPSAGERHLVHALTGEETGAVASDVGLTRTIVAGDGSAVSAVHVGRAQTTALEGALVAVFGLQCAGPLGERGVTAELVRELHVGRALAFRLAHTLPLSLHLCWSAGVGLVVTAAHEEHGRREDGEDGDGELDHGVFHVTILSRQGTLSCTPCAGWPLVLGHVSLLQLIAAKEVHAPIGMFSFYMRFQRSFLGTALVQ